MGGFVGVSSGQSPGGIVDQSLGVLREMLWCSIFWVYRVSISASWCFLRIRLKEMIVVFIVICVLMLVVCCLGWLSWLIIGFL